MTLIVLTALKYLGNLNIILNKPTPYSRKGRKDLGKATGYLYIKNSYL